MSDTVLDVFVTHLFLADGFRTEDREFKLIYLFFYVLLQAFFVENMVAYS